MGLRSYITHFFKKQGKQYRMGMLQTQNDQTDAELHIPSERKTLFGDIHISVFADYFCGSGCRFCHDRFRENYECLLFSRNLRKIRFNGTGGMFLCCRKCLEARGFGDILDDFGFEPMAAIETGKGENEC